MTMANIKTFACINRRTNAKVLANSLALSPSLSLSPFSSLSLLHSSLPSFPPFILGEELSEISTTNERTSRSRPNKIHFQRGKRLSLDADWPTRRPNCVPIGCAILTLGEFVFYSGRFRSERAARNFTLASIKGD